MLTLGYIPDKILHEFASAMSSSVWLFICVDIKPIIRKIEAKHRDEIIA